VRLAIFDVDGTLVDSRSMITAAMARAFADVGIAAPDQDRMLSIVGLSLVDAMAALTPDESAATHRRLGDAYKQAFWDLRLSGTHPEALFNGARDLLEDLRGRGVVLGIATGKSRRGVDHLIAAHGFANWFATVQTSDTHPSKPHPSMIVTALAETGCDPAATIMIGDTSFDMSMARQAGVAAAGVAWGNHPATELVAAGAHMVSNDFKQLALDLEALWEARGQ
jgi:phosphoglycolate phosphatase